jgi:polyketide cyclase/dehydrase/lipid transport protein
MRIEARLPVDATADAVWAVVSDPCAIGSLSDTLLVEELEPGSKPGVGTRYRALLNVGPVPVGGNVEIIEFDEPRDMSWTTLTGVDHRLRIRLRDRPDGGTWLTVRFAYDSPGLLGSVADLVSFPSVKSAIHGLLRQMVEHVEGTRA